MHEIMVIKEGRLKLFQVDDSTLSKLTRIRGNFYQDDPKLRPMSELPTLIREPQQAAPVISPEMERRAQEALNLHKMLCEAGERSRAAAMPQPPQPERPLTPEETWRHNPELRREFQNNFNAYQAYLKGVASGRCRIYSGVS